MLKLLIQVNLDLIEIKRTFTKTSSFLTRKATLLLLLFISYNSFSQITDSNQVFKVPVVIHVVYNSPEQNIEDDQIYSQIDVLNEDFRKLNGDLSKVSSDFTTIASDCRIEFILASFDQNGNETSGITRTETSKTFFFNDDVSKSDDGGEDSWGKNYLDIWVCNLPDGLAGWSRDFETDSSIHGVVIDYEFFGTEGTAKSPYHLGRTATHEIGHYFGLNHLEGTTGGCDDDDNIGDTPNQETSLGGALTSNTSCGTKDNTENFMQTLHDEYMYMFTVGQKEVMRANLVKKYPELIENASLTLSSNEVREEYFSVYPNPCQGQFSVTPSFIPESYQLFDNVGDDYTRYLTNSHDKVFRVSENLPKGVYLLRLMNKNNTIQNKIVVE